MSDVIEEVKAYLSDTGLECFEYLDFFGWPECCGGVPCELPPDWEPMCVEELEDLVDSERLRRLTACAKYRADTMSVRLDDDEIHRYLESEDGRALMSAIKQEAEI